MSNVATGSLPCTDIVFNRTSLKKPRKKRHRTCNKNKLRNTNFKKKRLKKLHSKNKAGSVKSKCVHSNFEILNILPDITKMHGKSKMSNWYWSNYKKAVEWQEKHRTAHWKACALALLEQNRYLLQIINQTKPGMASWHPEVSVPSEQFSKDFKFQKKNLINQLGSSSGIHSDIGHSGINDYEEDDDDDDDDDEDDDKDDFDDDDNNDDDDDEENENENDNDNGNDNDNDNDKNGEKETNESIEFELSEEMIKFFQQSYEYKMELQECKQKELSHSAEEELQQLQTNKTNRLTEMNLLYGEGSSMIIGMETAVQLSFDKYCDTKSPKYWPNIPFRLW